MSATKEFTSSTLAALSLSGRSGGLVKHLRGFRKDRHTVPDAVNGATQTFLARLCADELAEDAETWFQRAREEFGYKRREIALELSSATALLSAKDFVLAINWALAESDPGSYAVTRTLRDFRSLDFILGETCSAVFAGTFTDIVFTLSRGVAVEAVIDAVEGLAESSALSVSYPANCSECTLRVAEVAAAVRCTGATLEMVFPQAAAPRELIEGFAAVRSAFRLTADEALAGLL